MPGETRIFVKNPVRNKIQNKKIHSQQVFSENLNLKTVFV
jgi:hypothetical protein